MKILKYLLEFLFTFISFSIFKILGPKTSSNISGKIFEKIGPIFRSKKLYIKILKQLYPILRIKIY